MFTPPRGPRVPVADAEADVEADAEAEVDVEVVLTVLEDSTVLEDAAVLRPVKVVVGAGGVEVEVFLTVVEAAAVLAASEVVDEEVTALELAVALAEEERTVVIDDFAVVDTLAVLLALGESVVAVALAVPGRHCE